MLRHLDFFRKFRGHFKSPPPNEYYSNCDCSTANGGVGACSACFCKGRFRDTEKQCTKCTSIVYYSLAAEPIGQGGQLPAHFLLPMGKP